MNRVTATATAPSTIPEQSITASLTVEVMHDLDDGTPTLVASTQGNQGDLQVVTVDQARAMITEQRAHLNRQEQLARTYEAATGQVHNGVTVAIGGASNMTGRTVDLWATPDMDAYAYEAVYDQGRISLADAEASVRTQLAEFGVQVASFLNEDGPLTTAQSTFVLDDGLGARLTTPTESALRDIDDCYTAAENATRPFLAAKAVVHDYRPQAYGRRTEVWLEYGVTTGTLTPAKARDVLAAMAGFCAQFEAVIELAEREALKDFEGDPEIEAADREAEARRIRAIAEARA